MRIIVFSISLLFCCTGFAQQSEQLIQRSQAFHKALVARSADLSSFLDTKLSYGHSNGWLENKTELLEHLQTGMMAYLAFPEDSIVANVEGNIGYLRFVTTIKAALNGNTGEFHLKVLEVWRKENDNWTLYARQAIRAPL